MEGTCAICLKYVNKNFNPLWEMCYDCYSIWSECRRNSTIITTSGHPANQTYFYDDNPSAYDKWFEHMKKCGWVRKRRKWVRKESVEKAI